MLFVVLFICGLVQEDFSIRFPNLLSRKRLIHPANHASHANHGQVVVAKNERVFLCLSGRCIPR